MDGEKMGYRFTGADGNTCVYEIAEYYYDTYYSENSFNSNPCIYADKDPKEASGYPICSYDVCDVDFDSGKFGIKVTPEQYFESGHALLETFSPLPEDDTMSWREDIFRSYISLEGSLGEGKKDGDKTYLVYGVMDSVTGDCRMYNVYEYVYTRDPIAYWVYNSPMPD